MNDVARLIAELPDSTPVSVMVGTGTFTAGELRRAILATQTKRTLTTGEASELFGYSASMWAKLAAAGEVEGAYQDAKGGPWRLPYVGCDEYARLRSEQGRPGGGSRRGRPWGGTAGVSRERLKVVPCGSEAVGLQSGGDARSGGPRVARSGRPHRLKRTR